MISLSSKEKEKEAGGVVSDGVLVGRRLVDPVLVTTLITNPKFIRLVNAVKQGAANPKNYEKGRREVAILTSALIEEGFEEKVIVAALERVE
jgi:hypothetical protein